LKAARHGSAGRLFVFNTDQFTPRHHVSSGLSFALIVISLLLLYNILVECAMLRLTLPPRLMRQSAIMRFSLVAIVLLPLWLAIHWAVLLP
jgi:hypothetical protein